MNNCLLLHLTMSSEALGEDDREEKEVADVVATAAVPAAAVPAAAAAAVVVTPVGILTCLPSSKAHTLRSRVTSRPRSLRWEMSSRSESARYISEHDACSIVHGEGLAVHI